MHWGMNAMKARRRSAELLAAAVAHGAEERPGCAQILCGDFNSPKAAEVYALLLAEAGPTESGGPGLRDAAREAEVSEHIPSTIHKFQGKEFTAVHGDGTVELGVVGQPPSEAARYPDLRHIDWVLWRNSVHGLCMKPSRFEVVTDRLANGRYPSDHFPVSVTFEISAPPH